MYVKVSHLLNKWESPVLMHSFNVQIHCRTVCVFLWVWIWARFKIRSWMLESFSYLEQEIWKLRAGLRSTNRVKIFCPRTLRWYLSQIYSRVFLCGLKWQAIHMNVPLKQILECLDTGTPTGPRAVVSWELGEYHCVLALFVHSSLDIYFCHG